jgi:hypothetical protein
MATMTSESRNRELLVDAYQRGELLEEILEASSGKSPQLEELAADLATLHNEGLINLIESLCALQVGSVSAPRLNRLARLLKEILPQLNAPVLEVVQCVQHLCRQSANGRWLGTILDAFRGFCAQDSQRSQAALAAVEEAPEDYFDLLVPVLVAGSDNDLAHWVAEVVRLAQHENVELRKRALAAFPALAWGKTPCVDEEVVSTIEKAVEIEGDDEILALTVKVAFALSRIDAAKEARLIAVLEVALSKGGARVLLAASRIFGFHTGDLVPELLEILSGHLVGIQLADREGLENIDFGVAHLLETSDVPRGLSILEYLLRQHPSDLDPSCFDDSARAILNSPAVRSRVATRWLLRAGARITSALRSGAFPESSLWWRSCECHIAVEHLYKCLVVDCASDA